VHYIKYHRGRFRYGIRTERYAVQRVPSINVRMPNRVTYHSDLFVGCSFLVCTQLCSYYPYYPIFITYKHWQRTTRQRLESEYLLDLLNPYGYADAM
jgi:hypothetical protein